MGFFLASSWTLVCWQQSVMPLLKDTIDLMKLLLDEDMEIEQRQSDSYWDNNSFEHATSAGFYLAVKLDKLPALLDISDTSDAVYLVVESMCAADCSIAMMILLWNMHTSMKKSTTLINTLIIFLLTSGLITSIFAIAILITFATQQIFICIGLYFMFNKFYINSLLTTFNN
ncbi:hypothetical protein EVG20_g6763 [Dentipellis fragilis]|uniref:DUF6534 domain-containing protein n=1 Tax=Dentipellis fragilis TaxID=205917 RepID=A0A4Y9YIQ7_9AGAM|nr:hypothetical protein EVG20_g6763 [Dentipellis fragilis]